MKLMYDLPNVRRLHIELSSKCNASCPGCSRNLSGGPVSPNMLLTELSLNDIKHMVPLSVAQRITNINYCGNLGDPGTATDLLEILQYFRSANPLVVQQIRTNGGMRGEKFWTEIGEFFAEQPSTSSSSNHIFSRAGVVFSVDGLEHTNHIYRRGVIWEKVYANMKAYTGTGAFGVWEWLIFDHNQHQISEAETLATDLGLALVTKNPMGFGDYADQQTGLNVYSKHGDYEYTIYPVNFSGNKADADKLVGTRVDFSSIIAIDRTAPDISYLSRSLAESSYIMCKATEHNSSQELYISSTGHLLPCCFLGGVFGGQFNNTFSRYQFNDMLYKYGIDHFDLRKHSIPEILTRPEFSKFFLDGWSAPSIDQGKLVFCAEVCGKCSAVDKLYNSKEIK